MQRKVVKQHVVEMLHWQANNDKREALKKHIFNCMNKGRKQLFNIWKEALKICLLLSHYGYKSFRRNDREQEEFSFFRGLKYRRIET